MVNYTSIYQQYQSQSISYHLVVMSDEETIEWSTSINPSNHQSSSGEINNVQRPPRLQYVCSPNV